MGGFDRLFELLREQPFAGQERPEFGMELRALSHRPYRILYRLVKEQIVIARVIHHARDVRRALREG